MDEDNNDAPLVTRARIRRLSTLDIDSRSSTPLIDATVERTPPRLTRRTRLNSAITDFRTPTRSTTKSIQEEKTNNNNKESVLNKAGHVENKDNEVFEPAAATDLSTELPVEALPRNNRKSIEHLPSLTPDTKSLMIDKIQRDAKKVDFQGIAIVDCDAKPKFPKTPLRPTTSPLTIDLTETHQKPSRLHQDL